MMANRRTLHEENKYRTLDNLSTPGKIAFATPTKDGFFSPSKGLNTNVQSFDEWDFIENFEENLFNLDEDDFRLKSSPLDSVKKCCRTPEIQNGNDKAKSSRRALYDATNIYGDMRIVASPSTMPRKQDKPLQYRNTKENIAHLSSWPAKDRLKHARDLFRKTLNNAVEQASTSDKPTGDQCLFFGREKYPQLTQALGRPQGQVATEVRSSSRILGRRIPKADPPRILESENRALKRIRLI